MIISKHITSVYDSAWWSNVPEHLVPPHSIFDDFITLRWITGRAPRTGSEYYPLLEQLWSAPIKPEDTEVLLPGEVNFDRYAERLYEADAYLAKDVVDRLYHMQDDLTPVQMVHGDATFANAVYEHSSGRSYLIDPGHHRGLCVQEIDEAKMLQSYGLFDKIYRGIAQPHDWPPFTVRPVHKVLLASHYIRLLRHVKCEQALSYARDRIKDLVK